MEEKKEKQKIQKPMLKIHLKKQCHPKVDLVNAK